MNIVSKTFNREKRCKLPNIIMNQLKRFSCFWYWTRKHRLMKFARLTCCIEMYFLLCLRKFLQSSFKMIFFVVFEIVKGYNFQWTIHFIMLIWSTYGRDINNRLNTTSKIQDSRLGIWTKFKQTRRNRLYSRKIKLVQSILKTTLQQNNLYGFVINKTWICIKLNNNIIVMNELRYTD